MIPSLADSGYSSPTLPAAGQTYPLPAAGQTYPLPAAGQTYPLPAAGQTYPPSVLPAVLPDYEPETWHELCQVEPQLLAVEAFTKSLRDCRDDRTWYQIEARFRCFVGHIARRPALRSRRCHDICYLHLREIFEGKQRQGPRKITHHRAPRPRAAAFTSSRTQH